VWPDGQPRPVASSLNPRAFHTVANQVTVAVGPNRKIDLYNYASSVQLVADLAGYYTPGTGAGFTALTPNRVLDTRNGTGGPEAPFVSGTVRSLSLSGVTPTGATAVVLNLTGISEETSTYVTAWPHGVQQPVTSNLNVDEFEITANLTTVALPASNTIDLYNYSGSLDLIGDIAGYFTPQS
jgi:hypothetical protein